MGRVHLVGRLLAILHLVFPAVEGRRQDSGGYARGVEKLGAWVRSAAGPPPRRSADILVRRKVLTLASSELPVAPACSTLLRTRMSALRPGKEATAPSKCRKAGRRRPYRPRSAGPGHWAHRLPRAHRGRCLYAGSPGRAVAASISLKTCSASVRSCFQSASISQPDAVCQ